MTFDLLIASGYVAFSGITGIGDAADYIAALHSLLLWRSGLILCESVVYFLSMEAAAIELKRFCDVDAGIGRLFRLIWIPYVAAGCFACCSGILNKTMEPGAALGFAAAASFGAGSGMFGLPSLQRGLAARTSVHAFYVEWGALWSIAAAVVIMTYLLFIGPGVRWA